MFIATGLLERVILNGFLCFSSLLEGLVVPLQEKLEDWKKNTVLIDKDHAKGSFHDDEHFFVTSS